MAKPTASPGPAARAAPTNARRARALALRLGALLLLCTLSLQLYFIGRIALMRVIDPQSTSFQRSEAWRLMAIEHRGGWQQQWVDEARLGQALARAVIASEDAGFADHNGVEWDALEKAWQKNQRAEARVNAQSQAQAARQAAAAARAKAGTPSTKAAASPATARKAEPKVVGGSTITQQLAKNLFLSGERTLMRKTQEFVLTFALELLLDKPRILAIYLNSVEWGEGVFGAQAAARHYFHSDAARLDNAQAARLAVMLPAPKRFEKQPAAPYLLARSATIAARMAAVDLP